MECNSVGRSILWGHGSLYKGLFLTGSVLNELSLSSSVFALSGTIGISRGLTGGEILQTQADTVELAPTESCVLTDYRGERLNSSKRIFHWRYSIKRVDSSC